VRNAPERRYVPHLLGVLGLLLTAGAVGSAFAPVLAVKAPLVLVALSPLGRHLVLVAPETEMAPFVAVGAARRLFAFVVLYYLARAYGDEAFAWVETRYARLGRFARWFERVFRKAAPVVVLLLPGMSAPVAGATRMPATVFLPFAAVGVVAWVSVTYLVGDALSAWITPVLAFIRAHVFETTAACVVLVLFYQWRQRRRGRIPLPPS
jgi:membrane protein DedA with SNARE-associated domain